MSKKKRFLKFQTEQVKIRGIVEEQKIQEAFEKLQVNANLAFVDKKLQILQITSSVQDEGKTTACVNLAYSYVNRGFKVLVIDLDLRRPKLHRNFDLANEKGIVDYAAGGCHKDELIKKTSYGIDVVFSGGKTPYPAKVLESQLLADFIEETKEHYDYIILDTPPVSAVVDSLLLTKYSDGVLFIVQAETTKKNVIKESIKMLENAQANIVGLVLTSVKDRYTKYGYKYYYYE